MATLVVSVLAVPAAAGAAPSHGDNGTRINWTHPSETFAVGSGAVQKFEIPFTAVQPSAAPTDPVTVHITQKLGSVLVVDLAGVRALADGSYALPVSVTGATNVRGDNADIEGAIQVRVGQKPVSEGLEIHVNTTARTADAIPAGVGAPSADRVGVLPSGASYVVDEINVSVSFDVADPDALIRGLAATYHAVVQGAVSRAGFYQLRLPAGTTLARLDAAKAAIAATPGVDAATYDFFATGDPEAKYPNDIKWDSWDTAHPGGNNWNLEQTNVPGAWDVTTGARSVKIGVIDGGFDTSIEDLKHNINSVDSGGNSDHGNHVSGTICAEGDNKQGVTGVMWRCSLDQFHGANTTAQAVSAMASAVDAGDRVVNMSVQFVDNANWWSIKGYKRPSAADLPRLVDEANKTMRQGVLYAKRRNKDVLWVFAAGNESRDAALSAPGGLVAEFPENVMSVAATQPDGHLASFSDRGKLVSVAAPGTDIYSTTGHGCSFLWWFCSDTFGKMSGTSMAAPQVTGLAGLVLANDPTRLAVKVKECIVGAANGNGRAVPGETLHEINAADAVACRGGVLHLPAKVDVVFSMDLTGSMGGALGQAKAQLLQAMTDLKAAAPGTDFRFGVTSLMDYPGLYGSPGDYPFRVDAPLSADTTAIQTVVNGLALGGGGDGPEAYGRAFWEIGQNDTGATLGFRADALKLVINFGDNVPHDNDINQDITAPPLFGNTGVDPGRDGVVGTADDVDFQDDALAALKSHGIRLLEVDSSGGSFIAPYWQSWTATTGGAYTALGPADGRSLSTVIVDLLKLIP
ncbi:S8 family serine peptidase [Dactylosporangium sp. CA-139066]|uniref:S8 family serine peptidase n=1 Tax=Dactylosporangium sp. CA-139066 TaxID=3239930 RepID=UPI003D93D788